MRKICILSKGSMCQHPIARFARLGGGGKSKGGGVNQALRATGLLEVLGQLAGGQRPAVAVAPFAWAMVGMSIWSLGYGVGFLAPTLFLKLLALKLEYVGVVIVPVFLFIFSLFRELKLFYFLF